jgi:hypothetical protein
VAASSINCRLRAICLTLFSVSIDQDVTSPIAHLERWVSSKFSSACRAADTVFTWTIRPVDAIERDVRYRQLWRVRFWAAKSQLRPSDHLASSATIIPSIPSLRTPQVMWRFGGRSTAKAKPEGDLQRYIENLLPSPVTKSKRRIWKFIQ